MNNLTTAQIARLTAAVTGDEPRGSATKEAAARRFKNALADEIGKELAGTRAPEILACGFSVAEELVASCLAEADAARRERNMTPDEGPGLARLRAKPEAEAVRLAVLEDEKTVAAIKPRSNSRAALKLVEAIAPESAKPAREKKARAPKVDKAPGKRAAILEAAQRGDLPAAPDFSAETHKRFRAKLAEVVAAAEAGNLEALRAFDIKPISSSPKAIAKYRDLAVIALETRAVKGGAAA
jgi:hypothetical protein